MTLEVFKEIIETIKAQSEKANSLYKLGVDVIEFTEPYDKIWSLLLKVYYGKAGEDWISWFIFDRDSISGDPNQAWDENGNPICYDIPSLWKHVEELRCSIDFEEYSPSQVESPDLSVLETFIGLNIRRPGQQ